MARQVSCKNCKHSRWTEKKPPCENCMRFSKFEVDTKPRIVYVGHREVK